MPEKKGGQLIIFYFTSFFFGLDFFKIIWPTVHILFMLLQIKDFFMHVYYMQEYLVIKRQLYIDDILCARIQKKYKLGISHSDGQISKFFQSFFRKMVLKTSKLNTEEKMSKGVIP